MVTTKEVHSVTFDKGLRGYNMEQVDEFLDRIAEQLETDEKKIAELNANNDELKDKLLELAQKLEGYRDDEDALKSALLNAQRMGENVIKEARQKADSLEREARIRSEDILRAGMEKIKEQEIEMERIKSEVGQFKASVLGLYKLHIESLSKLPGAEERASVVQPVQEPVPQPDNIQEAVEIEEAPAQVIPEEQPVAEPETEGEETSAEEENFWQKDEEDLTEDIAEPMSGNSENFRGITFSD